MLFIASAHAADEKKNNNPKVFGTVWRIHGEVVVIPVGGAQKLLKEGEVLHVGEIVKASATGEALLKTSDAGMIAIRPDTQFVVLDYAAEGKATDKQLLRLVSGSLRLISGWIGKINPFEHKVLTPTGTIGIRGTDHEPYVLSPEKALATGNREGTYDKVNSGGTVLDVNGNSLDVDAGRVGFVRVAKPLRTRALMTLLLPVLLDKVPNFYVLGRYDEELDRYTGVATAAQPPPTLNKKEERPDTSGIQGNDTCSVNAIAKAWLELLDHAIANNDLPLLNEIFAGNVVATAAVRNSTGDLTTIEVEREELLQSALSAMAGLKEYKHRRLSLEAELNTDKTEKACNRIEISSKVIEQGRQAGKPYRFESIEKYRLEFISGKWLATMAETTQQ